MPIARLDSRAIVSVTGPDARSFLHNLLTQDVESLSDEAARFAALLAPQGRLLFSLFLFGRADGVMIDCAASQRHDLIKRLSMYRLRARVEICADPSQVHVAWGSDAPRDWPRDPRLPGLGRRSIGGAAANASESDWRSHQLALGAPDPEADCRANADYPIECGFDLLNGIDFGKGCFVGQETTSRMKRRGSIKTRPVPLTFEGPPPPEGSEVLNGDLRAGEVRSGEHGRAMALMRIDRMAGELTVEGRPARADPPAWLRLAT